AAIIALFSCELIPALCSPLGKFNDEPLPFPVQAQAIELFTWQVAKQSDSTVELLRYLPEVIIRFCIVTLKFCRIRQRPMRDNRLAGPKRNTFFGVVTHRDDKIKDHILVLIPRFWSRR